MKRQRSSQRAGFCWELPFARAAWVPADDPEGPFADLISVPRSCRSADSRKEPTAVEANKLQPPDASSPGLRWRLSTMQLPVANQRNGASAEFFRTRTIRLSMGQHFEHIGRNTKSVQPLAGVPLMQCERRAPPVDAAAELPSGRVDDERVKVVSLDEFANVVEDFLALTRRRCLAQSRDLQHRQPAPACVRPGGLKSVAGSELQLGGDADRTPKPRILNLRQAARLVQQEAQPPAGNTGVSGLALQAGIGERARKPAKTASKEWR
ncbi:hypothetical protein BurJ1DRAFT_2388 [Burkholderiales bacterium JOSHI_001]|nr:hypothetical protein BurJ1DRAFT_2388 [Burkholderiales bacterium JOSHI_001]